MISYVSNWRVPNCLVLISLNKSEICMVGHSSDTLTKSSKELYYNYVILYSVVLCYIFMLFNYIYMLFQESYTKATKGKFSLSVIWK